MFTEIKAILYRSSSTFAEDLIGVTALAVLLIGSLHLPSLM